MGLNEHVVQIPMEDHAQNPSLPVKLLAPHKTNIINTLFLFSLAKLGIYSQEFPEKISKRTPFWSGGFKFLKFLPCNNTTYNYSLVAVQAKKALASWTHSEFISSCKEIRATAPNYVVVTGGTLLPYIIYTSICHTLKYKKL